MSEIKITETEPRTVIDAHPFVPSVTDPGNCDVCHFFHCDIPGTAAEPFKIDGLPACGAHVDGGRCGRAPGHDGHPHIKADTVTAGEYEAAAARFNAISRLYKPLREQAEALIEAICDEYSAATEMLSNVQAKPGIAKPLAGEPYSIAQIRELEDMAGQRLARKFSWAELGKAVTR